MAHLMSIALADDEYAALADDKYAALADDKYAALAAEAQRSGRQVESLAHDLIAAALREAPDVRLTSRAFVERQYREGKILNLPTRDPPTPGDEAEREARARRLVGGAMASDMVSEDRGPR